MNKQRNMKALKKRRRIAARTNGTVFQAIGASKAIKRKRYKKDHVSPARAAEADRERFASLWAPSDRQWELIGPQTK